MPPTMPAFTTDTTCDLPGRLKRARRTDSALPTDKQNYAMPIHFPLPMFRTPSITSAKTITTSAVARNNIPGAQLPTPVQAGTVSKNASPKNIVGLLQPVHITASQGSTAQATVNQKAPQQKVSSASAKATSAQNTAISSRSPSRLLALPAELRNVIYEYALTEPTPIRINAQTKFPALSHANRQLRAETYKLWFSCNEFKHQVYACNIRLYSKWWCMVSREGVDHNTMLHPVANSFNWTNLIEWCKLSYERKLPSIKPVLVLAQEEPAHVGSYRGGLGEYRWS